MKKHLLISTFLICIISLNLTGQNAWFNEIHYDNAGTDVGEFIEVVIENPGSYLLSDFSVVLYNGNGGVTYDTKTLDLYTAGNTIGNFTIYTYNYAQIQNGGTAAVQPDGMALTYQGNVISGQFLSYEGSFSATNGPANGMTSTDIGVDEDVPVPDAGNSLQLSGTGTVYSAFVWNEPAPQTPGALNNSQNFGTAATAARIAGSMQGWNTTDPDYVMSMNGNGLYELTKSLGAGDWLYKVVEGDSWSDENYPSVDQHVVLGATENVTWKANITSNLVTHTLPVVAGNFVSELGGNDWDPSDLIGQMEDPDGDDIYTLEVMVPIAGNWECKVTFNHNWDQSTGGNVPFVTDGINSTIITYNFPDNTTSITGPPPPSAAITFIVDDTFGKNYSSFYLKGSWDINGFYDPSWGNGMEHAAFYDDGTNGDATAGDHIWTCQQNLVVDGGSNTWEWGVNDNNHNWIAGNWQFTVPDQNPQTLNWLIPEQPAIVINEIMYNSPGDDEEWIELYNNSNQTVSLENWKILDNDPTHSPIVIPAGYSVEAFDYFTIEVGTFGAFPFTPDYDGSGNFNLGNSGDEVNLYSNSNILTDKVAFTDTNPWPTAPDGNGPSLSLIDPEDDNSLPSSWAPSLENGGTPGAINFPPIPFITVTFPNGGEFLQQGETYTISWIYGFWENNIKIELIQEGEEPLLIVNNLPVSGNSFDWVVWIDQQPASNYKVKISSLNPEEPSDESDNYFSIIPPYVVPDIVISEIMYNPPESGNDSLEFVELYNNTAEPVNLEGFYFSKGVEFIFPSVEIQPDTFLLVGINSSAMLNTFGTLSLQWTSGALNNSGEEIELLDPYNNQVDYVFYGDYTPWDSLADGYGASLTLCNPDADNSEPYNWVASEHYAAINSEGDSIFATPGYECMINLLAAFEGNPTTIAVGGSVVFTDYTIGSPVSWNWTFEGGTPANYSGQNPPAIIYSEAGKWDVTLEVSDGTNTNSITYTDYIWSGYSPVADFHADVTIFPAGSYTNFFSDSSGEELTFEWYFEGGTPETSTDADPSEIYYLIMDYATYDVTLVVTNPFGFDSLTKEDYITTIPESVTNLSDENINLYPNPTDGMVTLDLPENMKAAIQILDITGREVFAVRDLSGYSFNFQHLEKGLYFVKIQNLDSEIIIIKRMIIQ